jgi:hypothetical protein
MKLTTFQTKVKSCMGLTLPLEPNVPSTVGVNVRIYFSNRRGERREREHKSKWLGPPSSLSP